MTTSDVAERLGVTGETVRRLIRTQRLRASVLVQGERRLFRIRRADYELFCRTYVRDSLSDDWE